MSGEYKVLLEMAKVECSQDDVEDFVSRGRNYFFCGFRELTDIDGMYYNYNIAIAIAIIGRLYTDKTNRESDYKRGVSFIASKAQVSRRHIKVLRKKFKLRNKGYVFRTPYDMANILIIIIQLLEKKMLILKSLNS